MQIHGVLAKVGLMALLGLSAQTQAQAQWNAYSDFYLSPTAAGWGGSTSPTALGTAWGYYYANVNGSGFPSQIGQYFSTATQEAVTRPFLYKYSDVSPMGGTLGREGASGFAAANGANFGYYTDSYGLGSSLGRVDTPTNGWFGGAPGISQGVNNYIWMQARNLGSHADGIAPILTWTAPTTGVFAFAGQFVSGNQPGNGAAISIVDNVGGASLLSGQLISRVGLANNSTSTFSFMASYNAGDVVQFQVGSNFATGNAVGLQVTATAIPEPSSGLLLTAGLGALGLVRRLRRQA